MMMVMMMIVNTEAAVITDEVSSVNYQPHKQMRQCSKNRDLLMNLTCICSLVRETDA